MQNGWWTVSSGVNDGSNGRTDKKNEKSPFKIFYRGQYGLIVLLLNWSPGIISVVHMLAYHRYF